MLLAFHGGGATGRSIPTLTHFNDIADRERFVVAYPDGYRRHWAATASMVVPGVDDVAFVSAMIDRITQDHSVDSGRVYCAGISNGGFFSQRLAMELPEKIRAIATVAATMPQEFATVEAIKKPVSVMLIHGTEDPLVPFKGGRVQAGAKAAILSAKESAARWAGLNGCSTIPNVSYLSNRVEDGTRVRLENYARCNESAEVTMYVIEGGGHTWPGGWQYFPERTIGRTSRNLDASEEIITFFKRH